MISKKATMNIALIDLNHMTAGVHTNTVPLGIGLIARYLTKYLTHAFDIRIFKDPLKFTDILKTWKPDCLGIAQYSWNSELNLYTAILVKKHNPGCLVIAGGPNLCLSREERISYLNKWDCVDICVTYDGEIPFAEIVKRLISGERKEDICRFLPAGTYSIDRVSGEFIEPAIPPPRLKSLDEFGSVYADRWFDDLLNDGFSPFLQTHRGCPFECVYCHTSDKYYSRMIFQSAKYFEEDMEYLGRRFAGRDDVTLYLANTNFSLFKEDFEIARVIRKIQDKYNWPKNINVNSGKDPMRLLKLLSILKYKFTPALSLQTLTPKVLKNIRRKNIPFRDFITFQREVTRKINKNTTTELILSLPEETKESFLKTVSAVLNSGVQNIVIYTLMALNGTLIATQEYAKRYGHIIRYRIVPRCLSEINGVKIFETEEVIVGTNTMSFDDYMDLRGLALIITVFASSSELFPIRRFLLEHKLNLAKWIFGMHKRIVDYPQLYSVYQSFLQETKNELFSSREAIIEFFSNQKNYELLRAGEFGDNLLRKYKAILLSQYYTECLKLAMFELHQLSTKNFSLDVPHSLLADLELFLKSRDVGYIFKEGYRPMASRKVFLRYDIPRWLESGECKSVLEDYNGEFCYSVVTPEYVHKQLKTYTQMNQDPELSLQILYRDGLIKDFWPRWISQNSRRSSRTTCFAKFGGLE